MNTSLGLHFVNLAHLSESNTINCLIWIGIICFFVSNLIFLGYVGKRGLSILRSVCCGSRYWIGARGSKIIFVIIFKYATTLNSKAFFFLLGIKSGVDFDGFSLFRLFGSIWAFGYIVSLRFSLLYWIVMSMIFVSSWCLQSLDRFKIRCWV